jgi:hypothetical protein
MLLGIFIYTLGSSPHILYIISNGNFGCKFSILTLAIIGGISGVIASPILNLIKNKTK